MPSRTNLLALAAAALLLTACGEDRVSTYRIPKEKDPDFGPAAPGAADAGGPAEPAAGASMADTAVPTAEGSALAWQAPAGWVQKTASAMRKGSYSVPGDAGESDLSITAFPGDVGGELANVNRWRSQIGLTPLRAEELDASVSRLESGDLKFTLVEIESKDANGKSILGAMVPFGGSTWFFKLMGPGSSVRAAKPSFLVFLRSVHSS